MISGQLNLKDALDRTIELHQCRGERNTRCGLMTSWPTIVVRPAAAGTWDEKHILIDGVAGLGQPGRLRACTWATCAQRQIEAGKGPYF